MIMAHKGDAGSVKVLIAAKADVNKADNDGQTALAQAVEAGNMDIIDLLKNAGAR